ncbi:MAG: fumarylacetoacetate hydrolase family protein [Calditerrivibrio sp.]|nr:fumarylacetoacetate hydrolase family protein [Calditerrivibrio sp.]MCA1933298.1 fumarylacetoacetate hydrolase family protein [Calditerrivibrio sp.]MCA1980620.1 fumarylacetoacetate hydrolase family protein [Calditerrivibrio sp.]
MKLCRFAIGKEEKKGLLENNKIKEVIGSFFTGYAITDHEYPLESVKILTPILPSKVVCVGRNYAEHAKELGNEVPEEPLIFMKPSTAVISTEEDIIYPNSSKEVHYEGELGVVIAKKCKSVTPDQAKDYILGFTCVNDVTARDIQRKENKFTRAKSFDTFCPIGPVIETEVDPLNLRVITRLNGEIKQNGTTKDMIHNVYQLISFISNVMTLLPGDVIATGTPSGVGPMNIGDTVEVELEGIGVLRNYVKQ